MKPLKPAFQQQYHTDGYMVVDEEYLEHCHSVALIIASQHLRLTVQQMLDLYAKMTGLE